VQDRDNLAILVVRGGALGDFLLTLPALEAIRAKGRPVHLYANPRFARLRPDLFDHLVDLSGPAALWLYGGGEAPATPYAQAIAWNPAHLEGARRRGTPLLLGEMPGLSSRPASITLGGVVGTEPERVPRLQADPARLERWKVLFPERPWVLAPGASHPQKVWPGLPDLAHALMRHGRPVVWLTGRDEGPWAKPPAPPLDGIELPDLVALAHWAQIWIGNDTGTTHLAAACSCKTIAFFGPTDPAVWAPHGATVLPFEWEVAKVLRLLEATPTTP
jgi:ADP-heptose:LPS heptosyltransferase